MACRENLADVLRQHLAWCRKNSGNLDTDAWTTHHRYTPLFASMNPAKQSALPDHIIQWHLVAGKDEVVPPNIVKQFIQSQSNAIGIQLDEFDHSCCWARIWPRVVSSIRNETPHRLPGRHFKSSGRNE